MKQRNLSIAIDTNQTTNGVMTAVDMLMRSII